MLLRPIHVSGRDILAVTTGHGVTIGEKSGSRASYLGIDINNDVTSGHIYEYTSFGELNPISAAADFRIEDGYVSVIGNKASGLVGSEAIINELYNANTGRLLGYMVEETLHEDYKLIEFDVTYHTFWFNIFDIVKIDNVKAVANGNIDPHKNNHDVYLNDSKNIFEPQKNSVKVLVEVKTSRNLMLK